MEPSTPIAATRADLPADLLADLFGELSRVCADGVAGLPTDAVLRMLTDAGTLQRGLDAIRVRLAGELASQSTPHLGSDGIARRAGHATPASFLAELWQISVAEARRLCDVGVAVRPRAALDGSLLSPRFPELGAAIDDLALGVEAAAVIVRELDQAAPFCSASARAAGEKLLVEHAPGLTVREVQGLARQVRDRLDEDGTEPRDAIRRHRRSLTLIPQPDGMVRLVWEMPPETAGLVRAAIDHLVGEQLRTARDQVPPSLTDTGVADIDDRTLPQRRSDAAEDLLRHAISCDRPGGDHPAVTMVVRMTLDQLRDSLGDAQIGTARIDGIDTRISATTARILAADANIIPAVLGAAGEIIDLGRARRLFSPAQRQALAEQYGGCAFPGCGHPPSYTEAHHLQWWSNGGATDLANGIPLCSFHHHRVHDDGWEIDMRDHIPYFIHHPGATPTRYHAGVGRWCSCCRSPAPAALAALAAGQRERRERGDGTRGALYPASRRVCSVH